VPTDEPGDSTGQLLVSRRAAAALVAGARGELDGDDPLAVAPLDSTTRTMDRASTDYDDGGMPTLSDARPVPARELRPAATRPDLPMQTLTEIGPTPIPVRGPGAPGASAGNTVVDGSQLIGGRYRLIARIGEGGMGKVYQVTHVQLGKTFALKVILGAHAGDLTTRQQFYREARMASSLGHPNIAGVVDFGEDDRFGLYMVMEFVDGLPLDKVLADEGPLSERAAGDIALQIADALHYIHQRDIVHNDIKTENILLVEEAVGKRRRRQAKLLDFGLARSLSSTRAHALTGTPHYVAPERIRGKAATPQSDVYAMGILLYELLTGKVPWDGPTPQILTGHLDHAPTPPSQLKPGLDPAVERLVLRALEKDPANRHKDMAAFLYELRTVMDMIGGGRGKSTARVVAGSAAKQRDRLARLGFDGCRLPLALLSHDGEILAGNPAFARFVLGVGASLEGVRVRETPLAAAWSHLEQDLATARGGGAVRRMVEVDVAGGSKRRLLLWIDVLEAERLLMGVQTVDAD
jgi:hypothetical protein